MNKRGHVLNAVLLAIGLGYVLEPSGDVETFRTIAAVSIPVTLGALFPDLDTAFGDHRKTFHNLPVLAIFLAWPSAFGNLHYVWIGVATHYLLDVAGSRRGIALFYPLSERLYGLPFGVPVRSAYTDVVTVVITAAELAAVAAVIHLDIPVQDITQHLRTIAAG